MRCSDLRVDADVSSVGLITGRTEGAGVHGFGEQFDDFDLDGRLIPIVAREQGVGRGMQPLTFLADVTNRGAGGTRAMSYAAWSSFVTGDVRGVRLDPFRTASHAFAVGDARTTGRVGLEVWAPTVRAHVTAAETPAALVAAQHTEARPHLAEWTQRGAVVPDFKYRRDTGLVSPDSPS